LISTLISSASSQKKQAQILHVARELFLERGYDGVSLDDIVERVGGSKSTLYSYYGGKEGLFAAMVQQVCADKMGDVLALDLTGMDPRAGLAVIGTQIMRAISQPEGHSVFRAMIAEAPRFPHLAEAFLEAGPRRMIRLLKSNIERWQGEGVLRAGDAEMMATQFLGIVMADFHTKRLLGLVEPMSERQLGAWVAKGIELFLEGALPHQG
jgi:AcrR family transcriptional regulator